MTVALPSLQSAQICLVPFWTTQPSYHELHLTGFELLVLWQVAPKMQIHTHMLLGMELIL